MKNSTWQDELRHSARSSRALLRALELESMPVAGTAGFPVKVPRPWLERIPAGRPDDPLLRQVLPAPAEDEDADGFSDDPTGEQAEMVVPGLIHRYEGRVLLVLTRACAIHCRYCFRRRFPYRDHTAGVRERPRILAYLQARPDVSEVILSGGDPLMLPDETLAEWIGALEGIPSLKRLRVHSRMPVVLPERLDSGFVDLLCRSRLAPVLVIHSNHPCELDAAVRERLQAARARGLVLLNQSVLLRGVNDEIATLAALSERLFECGVLPYYLHLLDRVSGSAHFEVPEGEASAIVQGLRERLPGYLVPRLVRDAPGTRSKQPLP